MQLVNYILKEYTRILQSEVRNKSWWLLTNNGKFFVESAWQFIRHKKEGHWVLNQIWLSGM